MLFADHAAVTPAGKLVAEEIPVAPVVAIVTAVIPLFWQIDGVAEGDPAVLLGLMVNTIASECEQPLDVAVKV